MSNGYGRYRRGDEAVADVVHVFTDGSSYPNNGQGNGGWGVVLLHNDNAMEIRGGARKATNNQMELRAILEGLEAIRNPTLRTRVYSDSKYCLAALTEWWSGWERRGFVTGSGGPVKNLDLLQDIQAARTRFTRLEFCWVKGHNGTVFNERADRLAYLGRRGVIHIGETKKTQRRKREAYADDQVNFDND